MDSLRLQSKKWMRSAVIAGCTLMLGTALATAQDAVPKSPAWNPPPFKEAFANRQEFNIWKRLLRKTDPLLRPPFAEQPVDTVKGLAAQIRSEELDVKNRVMAVEYLGKVDCVAYPEAQAMLIDMLHNDKWEEVRYAAALALKNMLTGCGQCSCQKCQDERKENKEEEKETLKTGRKGRYDECRGCCNKDVLNALAKTAYEYDDHGCCFEPSKRVREAAVEAIRACCIPCNYGPYMVPRETPVEPPVEPMEEKPMLPGEEKPKIQEEAPKPAAAALPPAPLTEAKTQQSRPLIDSQASAYPVIEALKGYCVVALKARMFVQARPELYSVYNGYRYHFWSEAAKAEFDRVPQAYAVQFNGADPVQLNEGQHVIGQFLREYDDRFYLFSSKENWETFKADPQQFLPRSSEPAGVEIVRVGALGRKAQGGSSPNFVSHPEAQ